MKKLGKFEIIEKVGQGAMGVVYKARDPFIDRIVALKTLTTGLAEDPNLLKRFYSEARSAGGLQHPNIVTIYELGHESSTPFIAMQFLSGESLDKIIDRRPSLPLSQKVGFIVYVCRALEYAHKQNPPVVHRDIKPGNVMVTTEGAVMVVDFGIARLGEGTRSQSAGMLIGTLGYMSPQLFRNSAADARSDIWATGVMFYELLAYRRPFEGDNAAALMSNIILEKPRSLDDAAPGTPADVQAVVDRMLAKEADARYQTMEEVLIELEPIWQKLRQLDVSKLLANGQQLLEAGDLENAKARVIQIIQIDTSNTRARTLLEKINAEVRRNQIVPQLKARVETAERLLVSGKAEEAKVEVEAALKLDSTFLPARELLGKAEAAIERTRNIAQALRASKQRMAEGALTEAELQLDLVLEMDPGNAAAREQLRLIKEERSRRERRKQRDETLHRARALWTNLQYEECTGLLVEALKQFPNDTEFSKLLESARQDQAEQHRQSLLSEARNLLSSQRFDDALSTLDRLLERFPSDLSAKNLRAHALQGRDQQIGEQRLAEAKVRLRSLVKQGKYGEVLKNGAPLSREFADDFELTELIDFARTELSHAEQKRRLEERSKQIHLALKSGHFSEAVLITEKALLEFPKNQDLLILLDRAKKEQSEKEKQEVLKQRLREVERLMGRQQLTDAIDLARQTLATVGQDSRIADTLLKAEKELEFRELKKQRQNETVQQARTLLDAGQFTDATSLLNVAIHTQLLPSDDPRVTKLLNEIDARREPPAAAAAAAGADAAPSPTRLGFPISSRPSPDPGKDYVYQRGTPLPDDLLSAAQDAVTSASSPTLITGSSSQLAPPPAPVAQPLVPEKVKEKKRSRESRHYPGKPTGIEETVSPLERTITDLPSSPAEVRQPPASPADIFEPQVEELATPRPQPIPRPLWKNPAVLGVAATLLIAISLTAYLLWPKHAVKQPPTAQPIETSNETAQPSSPPETQPETVGKPAKTSVQELYDQAEGYFGRKDWSRAKPAFQRVAQDPDADANLQRKAAQRMQEAQKHIDELNVWKDANAALSRGDHPRARLLLQQVVDMHLDYSSEANNRIHEIDTGDRFTSMRAQISESIQIHDLSGARQKLRDLRAQGGDPNGDLGRQIDASENQWFVELRSDLNRAVAASETSRIQELGRKFEKIAAAGGPGAVSAQDIVRNVIPNAIGEINAKNAWRQAKADCDNALRTKDKNSLNSAKNNLNPFLSGPYASEARSCLDQITAALNPPLPPKPVEKPVSTPPTNANPAVDPTATDKAEIQQLFVELSKVFDDRNVNQLKNLWPQIDRKILDDYGRVFGNKDLHSVARRYAVAKIEVTGDTATASGIWTGVHGRDGKIVQNDQVNWTAKLAKINGRWRLTDLR